MAAVLGLKRTLHPQSCFPQHNQRREWQFHTPCSCVQTLCIHLYCHPSPSLQTKADLYYGKSFSLFAQCACFLWKDVTLIPLFLDIFSKNDLYIHFEWLLLASLKLKKLSDLYIGQNFILLGFRGEMAHACVKLILLTILIC